MKRALIVCLLLAGCGSNPLAGKFTNRLSITLAQDEVLVNSMYGGLAITSKADPRDAEIIREMIRLRAMVEAIARAQAQQQRDKSITPL